MGIMLPKDYKNLKEGDQVRINGEVYRIKKRNSYPAPDQLHSDVITYKLENNKVLEYDWNWEFFEMVKKNLFLFTVTSLRATEIMQIEIV